jgi:hypothetical protein
VRHDYYPKGKNKLCDDCAPALAYAFNTWFGKLEYIGRPNENIVRTIKSLFGRNRVRYSTANIPARERSLFGTH